MMKHPAPEDIPESHRLMGGHTHPLSFIPLIRRWPASPLRNLFYTLLWNTMLSVFFGTISFIFSAQNTHWFTIWWPSFVISNAIGFLIHFSLLLGNRLTRGWPAKVQGWPRSLNLLTILTICVILGSSLGLLLLGSQQPLRYVQDSRLLARMLPFALLMALFIFGVLAAAEKRIQREAESARQREQIAANAALLAQAQLRALQAQVEPHFLYNTLANVLSLMQVNPPQAKHMLERLIEFLRANLAASRAEMATLGSEADLASSYLDLLAVRMGTRLRYRIEIASELRQLPLAPMLLQPLIENAVQHGLEPKLDGGEICLSASIVESMLCIQISDTGVGIASSGMTSHKPGGGVGMSNLRERLQSLYDGKAKLQLLDNTPSGVIVKLLLPLKT